MEKWIIAVSGGPDSMALLHKMISEGYECIVAHVNYHMREESDMEETMVRNFCCDHKVVFESRDYRHQEGGNFQHKARNFRYDFFKALASQYDARGVVVGHHKDDDIETYLIQKERKMMSDVIGLETYAFVKGIKVWRPLLGYTKDYLIKYCIESTIPYAIDKSNLETSYTRNRIRHAIKDRDSVECEMIEARHKDKAFKETIYKQVDLKSNILNVDEYRNLVSRPLILRAWIREHRGTVHHHRFSFFEELDRQILLGTANYDFGIVDLYCDHNQLVLTKTEGFKHVLESLPESIESLCAFRQGGAVVQGLSLEQEDFPITVRSPLPGDTMEMQYGTKSLSRFFIDKKIPRYRRKNWIVIENAKGSVIFVVGMGCDVHHYSNNPETFVIELNVS